MPTKNGPTDKNGIREKVAPNGTVSYERRYVDPFTHRRRSISAKTKKECKEKWLAVQATLTMKTYREPTKITVGQWFSRWMDMKTGLTASTRELYDRYLRLYVTPELGCIRIQDLRCSICQAFVKRLETNYDLSPRTVRKVGGFLSVGLEAAVKDELIVSNPASHLEYPKVEKKDPVVMDSVQQARFEHAIEENPYRNIFLTALHTGMRISEVLGLRWKDVSFKTCEIHVQQQLGRKKGKTMTRELTRLKTESSRRTFVAPAFLIARLKETQMKQLEWKLAAGPEWCNSDGLVFTRENGSPMPHNTVTHSFDRVMKRLGYEGMSFHSLRKTYITTEARLGTDIKTVAATVGHSSPTTTLGIYSSTTDEMKRAAAERRQADHDKQE